LGIDVKDGAPDMNDTIQKKTENFNVVVVGAGFAGLYMLYRIREMGLTVKIFEAGADLGGTWYWNRYPGARCDTESIEYSYQFSEELQQEWKWAERYATQPEILRYLNHVAERFDLRPDIQFSTRVKKAIFDEKAGQWRIETDSGDRVGAQFCVMATGCLSFPNQPKYKGLDTFEGPWYHTGYWPQESVDFTGKRVGIIGTGSSAVQAIPVIAKEAGHLFVFQRTANYSIPAHHGPIDPVREQEIKVDYAGFRARNNRKPAAMSGEGNPVSVLEATEEERQAEFEKRWQRGGFGFMGSFNDLMVTQEANDIAAEFVRNKIREIVDDPEVAELLAPTQTIGCKRMCLDSFYFETFNRLNVTLVDVSKSLIEEITPKGPRVKDEVYEVDCLIFAIGFDAMTGALLNVDIRGRDGITLKEKWAEGPRMYLGIGTHKFPNLFTVSGPGSPSVLTNMVPSIEQHVNWMADCIGYMKENGHQCIEANLDAEDEWVAHVAEVAGKTLRYTCNSWYLGVNIPGKPRVFMPYIGFPVYVDKCDEVMANGYEGFTIT